MSRHFNSRIKMCKLHEYVLCLFVIVYQCAFHVRATPCRGTASYTLQFQAEWKNTSRPAGAGFSGLIGCSHNKCYRMWREGSKASLGVRNVAERGDQKVLEDEINKLVRNRTTLTAVTRSSFIPPRGLSDLVDFHVDSIRPLVSVIAKITSFDDWFIGVHDLDLCDRTKGRWFGTKQVKPVYAYDADGISRISRHSSASWTSQERHLGEFHFSKMSESGVTSTGKFESDESVTCPDEASRSIMPCVFVLLISFLVTFTL